MSYRSAAIVAIVVPLGWGLSGAGCSDSGNSSYDPDAALGPGGFPVIQCQSDKVCRDMGLLCDESRHLCVQCLSAVDCPVTDAAVYECYAGACVSYLPCTNSLACPTGQVCDTDRTRCVECILDTDCAMAGKCVANRCRISCASDKDCTVANQLCDFGTGSCVSCLKNLDCGDGGLSCISGSCQKQLCEPGTTSCVGDSVVACSTNGNAWESVSQCTTACTMVRGVARCEGQSVPDASLPPADAGPSLGCGDLVDDMEDGDGYICHGSGRVGQWYTYGNYITPTPPGPAPAIPVSPAPIVPPRPGSNYAMHLMGASFMSVMGSALGVDLQLDGATYGTYNASAYSGFSFYAKGNVSIDILVDSAPTTSPAFGGICQSICTPGQTSRVLTTSWTFYTIPFSSLLAGNGGSTPVDKSSLTHIQFRVASATASADLWIDDLSFFR
jgi:hypothetical protein